MKTLIVIDMQNDFVSGSLGTGEARAVVDKVARKVKEYRQRGEQVIFTRDTHYENYLDTSEGRHLPVEHCIKGTPGWSIIEELDVEDSTVIDKESFGWMGWKDFEFEEVEMVGVCTDICVVSNALIMKAAFPELPISVDASCCAGVTKNSHLAAIDTMRMCQITITGE